MSVRTIGQVVVLTSTVLAIAGCVPGTGPGATPTAGDETLPISAGATDTSGETSALTLVARDVEAPDVFQADEEGLWDGRPSLGGVWVANKNVKDPERVIIRNPANGKSVIGALFRREADNPGPALQVSSDAADALGLLAGQPAKLSVVALKREEPQAPVIDAPIADATTADASAIKDVTDADAKQLATEGAVTSDNLDPVVAGASAAIDKAEGQGPEAAGTLAADAAAATADAVTPVKRKRHWWQRKDKAAAEDLPLDATVAVDDSGAAIPAGTLGNADTAVTAAPLDEPSALPATTATAPVLTRPYVQIGIFSTAANAQRAADQMKAAGMTATVRNDNSNGKTFWRVIVGPAASVAERDGLAEKVKGIGYPDAYPVKL